jgi:hypothetical protein
MSINHDTSKVFGAMVTTANDKTSEDYDKDENEAED